LFLQLDDSILLPSLHSTIIIFFHLSFSLPTFIYLFLPSLFHLLFHSFHPFIFLPSIPLTTDFTFHIPFLLCPLVAEFIFLFSFPSFFYTFHICFPYIQMTIISPFHPFFLPLSFFILLFPAYSHFLPTCYHPIFLVSL
jgi:hypothetical protein